MSRYSEALAHRDKLCWDMYHRCGEYGKFLRFFDIVPDNNKRIADAIADCIMFMRITEPFFWSKKMIDIVVECAQTLPEDTELHAPDFPVQRGFFSFEEKIKLQIINDKFPDIPVHIAVVDFYGASWELDEEVGITVFFWCIPYRESFREAAPIVQLPFFAAGKDNKIVSARTIYPGKGMSALVAMCWRVFASMILLLNQKFMVHKEEKPDKRIVKRLKQTEPKQVRVVYLRKPDRAQQENERSDEHKHIDWQYQWAVRGHWRNQYYRSTQSNKPIWINPYLKGPDDKPLAHSEKLFAVVR